ARDTTPAGRDPWCVRGSMGGRTAPRTRAIGYNGGPARPGRRARAPTKIATHRDEEGRMQGSQASTYHMRRAALRQLQPGIPARYYYDPQHYERELEVFWYGMWVMAGREEEVPAPRDYKVVKIGTQSIIILRDLDGQLRAFHNTCRHRGSVLCTEEQGRLA